MNQSQPIHLEWATGTPSWSTALPTRPGQTWYAWSLLARSPAKRLAKNWWRFISGETGKKSRYSPQTDLHPEMSKWNSNSWLSHSCRSSALSNSSFSARIIPMSSSKAPRKYHTRISMGRSGILESCYCWWFRNPPNQLRLVIHPIIYQVSAPSQVVVWHFFHQRHVQQFSQSVVGIRHKYLPKKNCRWLDRLCYIRSTNPPSIWVAQSWECGTKPLRTSKCNVNQIHPSELQQKIYHGITAQNIWSNLRLFFFQDRKNWTNHQEFWHFSDRQLRGPSNSGASERYTGEP